MENFPFIDFEMKPLMDCVKQFFEMMEHITFYFEMIGFVSARDLFLAEVTILAMLDIFLGHMPNHENEK